MMQPMNYTINQPDAGASFMQGASNTAGLMGIVADQRLAEQKAEAQRMANEQAMHKQRRFQEVAQNPTSKEVVRLMLEFPELSEQSKRSFDVLNDKERESAQGTAWSVLSALEQGKEDLALSSIDQQIEAAKNGGDKVSQDRLETLKNSVIASPDGARFALHGLMFSSMGGDKYASAMKAIGEDKRAKEMQPSVLKESEAKAEKAAVVAKFAESDAAMELQKKGWDIKKIQNDMQVSRQNVAIAAQNAAVSRANSETSRMEAQIKLQDLIQKRDGVVREKTAEVDSARASIDNMLNTADRILKTPMGVVGSAAGPLSARLPTLSQSTADFESLIENLDAQSFIAQIPNMKGTGALSDAEGKKLAAALQSFSLRQSPEQLLSNVKEAQRIMLDSRKRLASKYGVPDTVPNTPAAAPGGNDIDALLKKYGQ
jgi:broad-specificity NMP kinase